MGFSPSYLRNKKSGGSDGPAPGTAGPAPAEQDPVAPATEAEAADEALDPVEDVARSYGNRAAVGAAQGEGPAESFARATEGSGQDLPYRDDMESTFGQDFSGVEAHLDKGEELRSVNARAAASGESVAFAESSPDKRTVAHELAHVVQDREAGGAAAPAALDASMEPAEQQADQAADEALAGRPVTEDLSGAAAGTLHRLEYEHDGSVVADPTEAQADLDASAQDKATRLYDAIHEGDMRTIYMCLGGDNSQVKTAFRQQYTLSVKDVMIIWLPEDKLTYGLSFARFGKADVKCRVRAVTVDILGTKEEKLFGILESASMEERYALANDPQVLGWLTGDLSGNELDRALAPLRPLMNQGGLSETARQKLFAAVKKQEAALSAATESLLGRLRARKGFWNDDEDGMLSDVRDWAKARGPTELDEPALASVLAFLQDELSDRQYEEARNTIRTGNKRGLMDEINEAGQDTTIFWRDVDEDGILAAIAKAKPKDRQAVLNNPEHMARLRSLLSGEDLNNAMRLLEGKEQGEAATGLKDLLDELDSWLWVSDSKVFACLDKMGSADLVRIRNDDGLRTRIEDGLSDDNVARFHETIGYTGPVVAPPSQGGTAPTEEQQAADLSKSNARVVAQIEEAVDHWDDNEDKIYEVVIAWQKAGGTMDLSRDRALLDRAWDALCDLDSARREEIYSALLGSKQLRQIDRLESAVIGAGTDDTGLDDTLKDVTDEELVREWSNLDDYKAQAEAARSQSDVQALADFIPDIDNRVKGMLEGDRDDWEDLLTKLRKRLSDALQKDPIAKIAKEEFHYVVRERMLARLQYAQARLLADMDRGPGFWNSISMGFMDQISHTGPATEMAFGTYQGEASELVGTQEGSQQEQESLKETDEAYDAYITSHEEYQAAKKSAAAIGGAIVGIIVSAIVTIATAGSAGPACAALMGSLAGAAMTELTEAAIQGNDYSVEEGAQDLSVALVTSLMTFGIGKGVDKLATGAGKLAFFKNINDGLARRYPSMAKFMANESKELLKTAVLEFPKNYATDVMKTEGLLRQGLDGAKGALDRTLSNYSKAIVARAISAKVNDHDEALDMLKKNNLWDQHTELLLKKGLVDLAINTAATKLIDGKPLEFKDLVSLLGGVAATANGARLGTQGARLDASRTLDFFNTASQQDLQKVHGIGPGISRRIIEARGNGGFTSLEEIAEVPYFRDKVLFPAAQEVRDDFLKKKAEQQTAGAEGSGEPNT